MGFFSDVGGFLFGESPEREVTTHSTLSPEQQKLLRKLTNMLTGEFSPTNVEEFEGDLTADLSPIENLSLEALEQEALSRVAGESDFLAEARRSALDLLTKGPEDIDETFTKSVQQPLVEDFGRDILPGIARQFGGDFFGSERREADSRAREDLLDTLGRTRAEFAFNARENDLNRRLQAIGLAPELDQANIGALAKLLAVGAVPREVEQLGLENEFLRFQEAEQRKNQRLNQILAAIGLPTTENIATVTPGSEGLIPAMLVAAAGSSKSIF